MVREAKLSVDNLIIGQELIDKRDNSVGTIISINGTSLTIKWANGKSNTWASTNFLAVNPTHVSPTPPSAVIPPHSNKKKANQRKKTAAPENLISPAPIPTAPENIIPPAPIPPATLGLLGVEPDLSDSATQADAKPLFLLNTTHLKNRPVLTCPFFSMININSIAFFVSFSTIL